MVSGRVRRQPKQRGARWIAAVLSSVRPPPQQRWQAVQSPAQEAYPTHAITMISPFPPGGVSDTITRPLDAALEAVFKQPVVLENKTGAAGAVGAQYVAAAKPDGYTLLSPYRIDFRLRRR